LSGSLRNLAIEPRRSSRALRVKLRRGGGFVLVRPPRTTNDPNCGFDLAGDAG
jgi:hypothetical protein